MKMNLRKASVATSLALGLSTLFWMDGASLRGDTLGNCELELRPRHDTHIPGGPLVDNWEAQLYWEFFEDSSGTSQLIGTEYTLEIPAADVIDIGNAIGDDTIEMTPYRVYKVRAYVDVSVNPPTLHYATREIIDPTNPPNWQVHAATFTRGAWDPLGRRTEPTIEKVMNHEAPNDKRVRVWSKMFGFEIAFTLTDG